MRRWRPIRHSDASHELDEWRDSQASSISRCVFLRLRQDVSLDCPYHSTDWRQCKADGVVDGEWPWTDLPLRRPECNPGISQPCARGVPVHRNGEGGCDIQANDWCRRIVRLEGFADPKVKLLRHA